MRRCIEIDSLWKCRTCFYHQNGKCSPHIWCECGESYRPAYSKLTIINTMDKFEAVDKFKNLIMDEFISLCDCNDFGKINLLTIDEVVNRIYEKCINDMANEDEK